MQRKCAKRLRELWTVGSQAGRRQSGAAVISWKLESLTGEVSGGGGDGREVQQL